MLVADGIIDPEGFIYVIQCACIFKKYEWARKFRNKTIRFLDVSPKNKERIERQTEGYLLYGEGKFKEGLSIIKQIVAREPQYFFQKSVLAIKMSFQLYKGDTFVEIDSEIAVYVATVNRYLNRKRINHITYDRYMNFLAFLKKIVEAYSNDISIKPLLVQLERLKYSIAEYTWLKEQIHEIPNKKVKY